MESDAAKVPSSAAQTAMFATISVFLVLFAGLMSGLTLGLLSMEEVDLRVIEKTGDPRQQRHASKVIELIRKPHWLLVTLLLCNALAMEALPIVLDKLFSPVLSVLISVTAVLFFGEIFPQAACKAKGLAIGAWSAPLVNGLMLMLAPIAWPISKLLDYVLIHFEAQIDERTHMEAEVKVRRELGQLTVDEETVICGALELSRKTCSVCMTPLEKVRALAENAVLDAPTLAWILQTGHSRIPVYPAGEPQNLNRVLLVKTLLCYNPEEAAPVSSFKLTPIVRVSDKTRPYQLLDHFQTGRSHMAAVFQNDSTKALGIITLEDVIEELTQEEIVDETDQYVHVEAPSLGIAEDWRMQCNLLTPLSRNLGKATAGGLPTPTLDP
mmetsp:Transcript_20669/g.37239  ORF Transcript_20669/g.37239 Transcript_20669/m.37239 type:complete len:382 (+) Transcript_20669:75-1220(+)